MERVIHRTNLKRDGCTKIRNYITMQFSVSICSLYASNLNCGFRQSPCFSWRQFNELWRASTIPTSGVSAKLPATANLAYYSPMTFSSSYLFFLLLVVVVVVVIVVVVIDLVVVVVLPISRRRSFSGSPNTVAAAVAAIARNGGCELSEGSDTTASHLLQPSSNLSRG